MSVRPYLLKMLGLNRERLIGREEGRSRRTARPSRLQSRRTRRRTRFADEDDEEVTAVDTDEDDLINANTVSATCGLCPPCFTFIWHLNRISPQLQVKSAITNRS